MSANGRRLLRLLLPLLLFAGCRAEGANSTVVWQCFVDANYAACSTDPSGKCPPLFFLTDITLETYRRQVFAYLLDLYATRDAPSFSPAFLLPQVMPCNLSDADWDPVGAPSLFNSSASCQALSSADDASDYCTSSGTSEPGLTWWLALLQQASFCGENEVFVSNGSGGGSCECKPGKKCNLSPPSDLTFARNAIFSLVSALGLYMLWRIWKFQEEAHTLRLEQTRGIVELGVTVTDNAEMIRKYVEEELAKTRAGK